MSLIVWLFIDILGITSYMGNFMKSEKFKSWYPLGLITITMWISVLLSYTVTKYYLSVCNYFRLGELQIVENGVQTTQFDTACIIACLVIVMVTQSVFLMLAVVYRNLSVENSPKVMTFYYFFGIILSIILGIVSMWSNICGYDRVYAMRVMHSR